MGSAQEDASVQTLRECGYYLGAHLDLGGTPVVPPWRRFQVLHQDDGVLPAVVRCVLSVVPSVVSECFPSHTQLLSVDAAGSFIG